MSSDGWITLDRLWKQFAPDHHSSVRELVRRLRRHPLVDGGTWALRDVSLTVASGEAVGLIGSNGSGKSTLLHLVNGGMQPTAGTLRTGGRVSALIEIRAGLHPDLTGRENVHLLAALMGHGTRAVRARFDELVEFAELADALDRQVKHYSQGMKARLGFALATGFDTDVLLVDEVLAVGDAQFQERCLAHMAALRQRGTTVVYVSHDLESVQSLCPRVVWLERGRIRADGEAHDVLASYRNAVAS